MSILVCTPMFGGMCTAAYFQSSLNLRLGLVEAGVPHDFHVITNESLVPRARNEHVRAFLASDFEALLFIDADIEFTEADVANLWNMEQDVACGLYRMKRPGAPYAAWRNGALLEEPPAGPFQVDYAGTGFMMIRRAVFSRLEVPEYDTENGVVREFFGMEVRDRCLMSEDYLFCLRCREEGIPIWAHPEVKLIHHGSYGYGKTDPA